MTSTRAMRRKRMSKRRQRGGFLEGLTEGIKKAFGFGSETSGASSSSTKPANSNVSAESVNQQMNGETSDIADKEAPLANQNLGQQPKDIPDPNEPEGDAHGLQAGGKRTRRSKKARRVTQRRRRASSRKAAKK